MKSRKCKKMRSRNLGIKYEETWTLLEVQFYICSETVTSDTGLQSSNFWHTCQKSIFWPQGSEVKVILMSVMSSFKKSAIVIMGCCSSHSCTGHYANDLNSRQQDKDPLLMSIGSELGTRRVFLRKTDGHTLHTNFCMISLSVMSSYVVGTEL
jgi:hypothetical protein